MGITPSVADRAGALGQTLRPRPVEAEPAPTPEHRPPRTLRDTTVHIVQPMSWPMRWQLASLSLEGMQRSPNTLKYEIKEGSIARMRNEGVREAREAGAACVLFADADMWFEEDALKRLVEHNVPVVGGHCLQTSEPFPSTLWRRRGKGLMRCEPEGHGLMEVDGTGAAFLLVDVEVFHTLDKVGGQQGAYFRDHRDRMDLPPEERLSEDLYFCSQVRKAGYPVYVDLDTRVGHWLSNCFVIPDENNAPQIRILKARLP